MAERKKKVPYRKGSWAKKSLYKKEDEVKNRATEAKKKSPNTEVNNRMAKRKKSPIEKEKYDEVKNRADERTENVKKKKKIHQCISKSPMAIYNQ